MLLQPEQGRRRAPGDEPVGGFDASNGWAELLRTNSRAAGREERRGRVQRDPPAEGIEATSACLAGLTRDRRSAIPRLRRCGVQRPGRAHTTQRTRMAIFAARRSALAGQAKCCRSFLCRAPVRGTTRCRPRGWARRVWPTGFHDRSARQPMRPLALTGFAARGRTAGSHDAHYRLALARLNRRCANLQGGAIGPFILSDFAAGMRRFIALANEHIASSTTPRRSCRHLA